MIDQAINWIKRNSLPEGGIIVHSRKRICYPEVTGYFIPTLLSIGERELANQYMDHLLKIQKTDGSFFDADGKAPFAFDTGQIIRGFNELLPQSPELELPLRKACDWLISSADPATGRLLVPAPDGAWRLGDRGEVNECIHLYVLGPMRRAGELLNEPRYQQFVDKSLKYYLSRPSLTDFRQRNALTHFYAYMMEALVELGCLDEARKGMESVAPFQQENGSVPGYSDVPWVCSTGLAQLAIVWYALGESKRADQAMEFLEKLQNPSGGFFGSYGVQATYFPAAEIAWATKYAIEAGQRQIADHFNNTASIYREEIAVTDGRSQAILKFLGDLNGKRVLDAGCGKGRYLRVLRSQFPGAQLTGLDISSAMLAGVPEGVEKHIGSLLELPFENESFDGLICVEALEHAVNIEGAIREQARVLKPGGRLVIIDKNADQLGSLKMPSWEKWFKQDELTMILSAAGFDTSAEAITYERKQQADGLFLCWTAIKTASCGGGFGPSVRSGNRRRLAVVPSDPLAAYSHKTSAYLKSYFNPEGFFDEVYVLSPKETVERDEHGMHIIPTQPGQLADRIRDLGVQIVRAYGGYWACDFATAEKVPGVPVIVSVHDTKEELLFPSIARADIAFATSEPVRELIHRRTGDSVPVFDLPNRVDFDVFRPCTNEEFNNRFKQNFPARYRIVHVGRKAPQKNADTLIRALRELGPEYSALFIGPGKTDPYLALAGEFAVEQQCHFLPSVSNAELYQYYSRADCVCMPSRWEGFGMVFTEALASGAALVSSDIRPINQIVVHGLSGILVKEFEDPTALANAIREVCEDASLNRNLRAAARPSVERFRRETIDAHEVGLYRKAMAQLRAATPSTVAA